MLKRKLVAWGLVRVCVPSKFQSLDHARVCAPFKLRSAIQGKVQCWARDHVSLSGKFPSISVAPDQLRNVQHIQCSSSAFAAILADGFVVTWGDVSDGGNGSAVQNVQHKPLLALLQPPLLMG